MKFGRKTKLASHNRKMINRPAEIGGVYYYPIEDGRSRQIGNVHYYEMAAADGDVVEIAEYDDGSKKVSTLIRRIDAHELKGLHPEIDLEVDDAGYPASKWNHYLDVREYRGFEPALFRRRGITQDGKWTFSDDRLIIEGKYRDGSLVLDGYCDPSKGQFEISEDGPVVTGRRTYTDNASDRWIEEYRYSRTDPSAMEALSPRAQRRVRR